MSAARGGKFFQSSGKMMRPEHFSDEDSSDDSEEEEVVSDDEEEEEESLKRTFSNKTAPPAKKRRTSTFFDEEAEASGDEDEEEDSDEDKDPHDVVKKHYTEEDIRREQMDEEARELIRRQDRRRQQAGGNRFMGEETSVADMARDIENRHRMSRRTVAVDRMVEPEENDDYGEGINYTAVSQQSLLPSVSDPSLWMISCNSGKEAEFVYQLLNKCAAYARQGRPLAITAAIAGQTKGKIYIESYSEPAVKEAVSNVRGLMPSTLRLVPITDMATVMTVTQTKKPVKENDWVRMTRGHYKGDLALVKSVRDSGLKCIIQCVPRLDLTLSDLPPEEARFRKRNVRPPQKFFNAQELIALGKHNLTRQRYPGLDFYCDYYEGSYYHDGYLLKEVTVGSMIKPCEEEDMPTLDELQRFRQSRKKNYNEEEVEDENEGSKMAASLLDELSALQGKTASSSKSGGLLIGDTVEVIEGDLVGLQGKLSSVDGATVKVTLTDSRVGGTQEVEFLASQVRKSIAVGAHVKVMDGRYANETGSIVSVVEIDGETDCNVVVVTDVVNKEITVRMSQLRESAEMNTGQDKLQGYELHDLVQLSGGGSTNEVGVIVRVGAEDFTVINGHGNVREVRPEELRGKHNARSNRALTVDTNANPIRVGDTVNVLEGAHKGKTATVKRISRTQLFVYSQTRAEHAGIFVVRGRSCLLAGSRNQNRGSAGDGGVSPFSTPQSQTGNRPAGGRPRRDDALIGKTVRIQAGKWKGYLGTVADATATHVKVELHSRLKTVPVLRERVAVAGDKFGATEDTSRTVPDPSSMMAPTTPFVAGAATPMYGGATPLHGGATPMHDGGDTGDAADIWKPGGSIDQEPAQQAAADSGDGWGPSSPTEPNNPFGSPTTETDDGWGSSAATSGSTWTPATNATTATTNAQEDRNANPPPPQQQQQELPSPVKHEQPKMEDTDMADADDAAAVWFMERVCVQLKSDSNLAVIKEIHADKTATVEVEADKSSKTVRVGEVSMVPPKEHDMVLVTGGADVGVEGELVCIDGSDAILKDSNEDFKIVDFVHLAKIAADT